MKVTQKLTAIALLVFLAAGVAGLYLTSHPFARTAPNKMTSGSSNEFLALNSRYLETALRLAGQARGLEEQRVAQQALNAADLDLDLQYGYALQLASTATIPETPEIEAIQQRITNIEKAISTRKAEVDQLESRLQGSRGARRTVLEQQLEVRRAELGLFQEVLGDARDSLNEAGGSLEGRLAKLKAEHAAASKEHDTFKFPPLPSSTTSRNMLAKWLRLKAIYQERSEIRQAQKEAYSMVSNLVRRQQILKKRIATEEAQRKVLEKHELTPQQIAASGALSRTKPFASLKHTPQPTGKTPMRLAAKASTTQQAANPAVALIGRISADRAMDRILTRRIQTMNSLGSAYGKWDTLLEASELSALHSLIAVGVWTVLILACAFFLNRLIEHSFVRLSLESKQRKTLQAVLHISVRLTAAIVILMIVFGTPHNLSTVLALAGAGLAVALQDFILSFLGWFLLMGRHGIRVGDWVEINPNSFTGVRGEVIEITLFRTVLLETGNWNEPGHLTGRQVAFMNMYAVSGYFFNFSTSGQWLWDELEVAIPRGQNPYLLTEKIKTIVANETESYRQLAELEWQRVSKRYGTRLVSAQPAVNIRPTDNGVIAIMRYITRVDERSATRYRLNHEIIKLIHQEGKSLGRTESLGGAETSGPDGQ